MDVREVGFGFGVGLVALGILLSGKAAEMFGASSWAKRAWAVVSFARDLHLLRSCVRWRRTIFCVRRGVSFASVGFRLLLVCKECMGSLSHRSLAFGLGSRGGSCCARYCYSRWHRFPAVVATGCDRDPPAGRKDCSPTPYQHCRYAFA